MQIIETNGIQFIELLSEKSSWYCGTDYSCGDLYEAEEIYSDGGTVKPNRLIFIRQADGKMVEPIKLKENQYFGRPTEIDGVVYILLVDFSEKIIRILESENGFKSIATVAEIPIENSGDCFNLLLHSYPLMLTRQRENNFEVVWQNKIAFSIGETEAFLYKKGENFYFSRWIEDPDYREEVVVRNKTGEVLEIINGSIFITPAGEEWILR